MAWTKSKTNLEPRLIADYVIPSSEGEPIRLPGLTPERIKRAAVERAARLAAVGKSGARKR